MQPLKIILDIYKSSPALFVLLLGFGLFPIYTSLADLPFWNDVAMRIMLLGMAALGLNLVLGFGGMVSFGHAAFIGIGAYTVGISQFYGLENGWLQIFFATSVLCYYWPSYWFFSPQNQGYLFYYDHASLCTNALFFLCQP